MEKSFRTFVLCLSLSQSVLIPAAAFEVSIKDTNYSPSQKLKLSTAEGMLRSLLVSEDFKEAVISRKYTSTALNGEEVYKKLIGSGKMDLKVTMYFSATSKVVGYTYPNSNTIFTNAKFYNRYFPCDIASNLTHEWSHKLGFEHSSASDRESVPYSLNEIIKRLCKD